MFCTQSKWIIFPFNHFLSFSTNVSTTFHIFLILIGILIHNKNKARMTKVTVSWFMRVLFYFSIVVYSKYVYSSTTISIQKPTIFIHINCVEHKNLNAHNLIVTYSSLNSSYSQKNVILKNCNPLYHLLFHN